MNLISRTYHSYERRKYAFMVLREYTIISHYNEVYTKTTLNVELIPSSNALSPRGFGEINYACLYVLLNWVGVKLLHNVLVPY